MERGLCCSGIGLIHIDFLPGFDSVSILSCLFYEVVVRQSQFQIARNLGIGNISCDLLSCLFASHQFVPLQILSEVWPYFRMDRLRREDEAKGRNVKKGQEAEQTLLSRVCLTSCTLFCL